MVHVLAVITNPRWPLEAAAEMAAHRVVRAVADDADLYHLGGVVRRQGS